jgi:predicted nucleic acid-binding protein
MSKDNIIIDASVIIKWLLPDEEDPVAMNIKNDFAAKEMTISIPYLTYYEVGNVLKIAVKRDRITKDIAEKLYQAFVNLDFVVYATRDLSMLTISKTLEYDISFYDASYIALAEYLNIPFLTADSKLANNVDNKLVIDLKKYNV